MLNRLEEAGLVVGEFRAAERGRGRRSYRSTTATGYVEEPAGRT